ncbi:dTDP-4-dehydrorhamnose reductase [Klosneuvirus KNV1]|uniref:dTDP-4-dehydrorhamnose reductase n=1 Tax=Klosneuvirus KNV1 TaxID=1977640 RepID=A0A1V0SLQ6_9VIRU|nr:dTDP-4-dehydrorhamnose reductase [Klosneuvirus KNV1]
MKWLVFGLKGWLGGYTGNILRDMNEEVIEAKSRADDEDAVEKELLEVKPDRVISLIGRTYGPGFNTIDYLEQKGKLVENIRDNLYGPFVLATLCTKHQIHATLMGTGCIFSEIEQNYGDGYTEEDKPDFFGSSYSTVRGYSDRIMHFFENSALNLRIRMPLHFDISDRNFITKITKYKKICNRLNSMTSIPHLFPIMIDMAKKKITGTINLTNPGVIDHNEILSMYREIVDSNFTWENFTYEEQRLILLSDRSNNKLNTNKLQQLYPNVLPIKEAVREILYEMKKKMNK